MSRKLLSLLLCLVSIGCSSLSRKEASTDRKPSSSEHWTCRNKDGSFSFTKDYDGSRPVSSFIANGVFHNFVTTGDINPTGSLGLSTYVEANGSYLDMREVGDSQFAIYFDSRTSKITTYLLKCSF